MSKRKNSNKPKRSKSKRNSSKIKIIVEDSNRTSINVTYTTPYFYLYHSYLLTYIPIYFYCLLTHFK